MQALPIDPHLPAIVAALRAAPNLVLVAEPGAGKTTRLPRALLDAGFATGGEILVLEPRRIAARMAARRVAEELAEQVGRRVGYQVRFEDVSSAQTRVRFVTEGVLTRKLVSDPLLPGVTTVLLDEFHERHLQGDLALALLRRLQRGKRPELRLVVMSATLEADKVARFLECEAVHVPGRRFDVAIEYTDKPDERALEQRVAAAVRRAVRESQDGDVLVFLPGAGEIRRAREALEAFASQSGLELALLHGDLPAQEQDRAVARSERRKVILSTNVAESSLTIEGVTCVVDSGLARSAGHSPWSGLPTLNTVKISRASAAQRAGRAGRVREGRCLRLYTRHDHDARPAHDKPEIARADLCETLLAVKAIEAEAGMQLDAADWLEPPAADAQRAAEELLALLGAVDAQGRLAELGRRMLKNPLHPRLARVLIEADARGVGRSGALLAALLAERDIARQGRARFGDARRRDLETGPSDALERLERFEQADAAGFDAGRLRALELDNAAVRAVARMRDRLVRSVAREETARAPDEALLMALLAGFGDRVARRRAPGQEELVLARGGSVAQSQDSVVREAEWLVVLDASENRGKAIAHLLSALEPEWLLELFPDRVLDRTELRFDERSERIEAAHALRYDGLLLDESRAAAERGPAAEAVLYAAALARGPDAFAEAPALELFERRVAYGATLTPGIPALPEDARARALRAACDGKLSFSELREEGLLPALHALLTPQQRTLLEKLVPEHVALAHGRRLPVHYEQDRPPWVQSRLQDFFGLRQGPKLGDKPLVLHLLAPNQRALQVTTDLAGFWERHYPELRRQLMRRYPKHAWPEDPLTAKPPIKAPGRR